MAKRIIKGGLNMRKIFCDICGEEMKPLSKHYSVEIDTNVMPDKFKLYKEDVCDACANSIHHYIEGLKPTKPVDNDT